jgi:uncharacterized lipoprotein YmbA
LRLDRQLGQIGKLARQLVELLSAVDAANIPVDATRDLWVIHGRIEKLSGKPRIPSIEAAEKVAGVKSQTRPLKRGEKRQPGLSFKKQ